MSKKLQTIDRGLEEFADTLAFQQQLVETKVADRALADMLVLVEHPEVFTAGRGTPFVETDALTKKPVKWIEINRGGQATFHGPGQLVAYPIFDLNHFGNDVHIYLRKLEDVLILALRSHGIYAFQREGLTGIWTKDATDRFRKIASIGVGVRKWITYHGIALNVSPDLDYFRAISPCGQPGEVMTSIAEMAVEQGTMVPTLEEVKVSLVQSFRDVFGFGENAEAPIELVAVQEPEKLVRPSWLKVRAPGSPEFMETRGIVKKLNLVTVCEEARCPNIGECWSHRTATFMIMGELCTRRCSFCSVKDGTLANLKPLDPLEPFKVGTAVRDLGLKHIVITSVNRDDLDDMGAEHFHRTVQEIARLSPTCQIELLIPDMAGKRDLVETILKSGLVKVLNHNVETVPRLYKRVRPGASLKRSLNILRWAKEAHPEIKTKSGLMVGLGETAEEVLQLMDDLRSADVNILTIGQYLQPSQKQLPVHSFVTPEQFAFYKAEADKRGFSFVESGPLVRSSYHAWKHSAEDPNMVPFERASAELLQLTR